MAVQDFAMQQLTRRYKGFGGRLAAELREGKRGANAF